MIQTLFSDHNKKRMEIKKQNENLQMHKCRKINLIAPRVKTLEVSTPFLITSENLNRLKPTILLRLLRELNTKGKPLPPKLERLKGGYRESDLPKKSS